MSQSFEFVFSDDPSKLEASCRVLIRSHCMKGRNRQPGSRRSLRQARRAAAWSRPIVGDSGLPSSSIIASSGTSHTVEESEQASGAYQSQNVISGRISGCVTSAPPSSTYPNLNVDCLGMKLDCEYWQVLHECEFASKIAHVKLSH